MRELYEELAWLDFVLGSTVGGLVSHSSLGVYRDDWGAAGFADCVEVSSIHHRVGSQKMAGQGCYYVLDLMKSRS